MKKLKASVTVETALVLPVFMFASITLISLIHMMSIYARMEGALSQAGRELSVMGYVLEDKGDEMGLAMTETYVRTRVMSIMGADAGKDSMIVWDALGISLIRSDVYDEKGNINLIMTYTLRPYFALSYGTDVRLVNHCMIHSWIGYVRDKDENESDPIVYVAENGTVYHTSPTCTHLSLSISSTTIEEVPGLRNENGGKYYPCEVCYDSSNGPCVYITEEGDRYHSLISCSGLKRTIYEIHLSEVGGKPMCQRCASYIQGMIREGE